MEQVTKLTKNKKNKRNFILTILIAFAIVLLSFAATQYLTKDEKIKIDVLILPKFEIGEMTGDKSGEAQLYYDEYVKDGEEYEIKGGFEHNKLYVKDGVALYVTGMGKVNTTASVMAVLGDNRFDFSHCYVISVGCAGGATGATVLGDVVICSAALDFDLCHKADYRDFAKPHDATWIYIGSDFVNSIYKKLNRELVDEIFNLVKDVEIPNDKAISDYMKNAFPNEKWALRAPRVMKGTTVTGDTYWKGEHMQKDAQKLVDYFKCVDPFMVSEMEDIAVALACERMGMLDRLIIVRDIVNMVVFIYGQTPENLWMGDKQPENKDFAEIEHSIFRNGRVNNFNVGKKIIDELRRRNRTNK